MLGAGGCPCSPRPTTVWSTPALAPVALSSTCIDQPRPPAEGRTQARHLFLAACKNTVHLTVMSGGRSCRRPSSVVHVSSKVPTPNRPNPIRPTRAFDVLAARSGAFADGRHRTSTSRGTSCPPVVNSLSHRPCISSWCSTSSRFILEDRLSRVASCYQANR